MKLKIIYFVLFMSIFYSCSDIFEHNLSNDVVQINSPGNNTISETYSQVFWWGKLDNALTYNLQIASPAFDSSGSLLFDTTTSSTKVSITLNPGNYQWRVKGLNGSSSTNYTTYNLRIDTGSLASQTVDLLSPPDNYLTNQTSLNFQWQGVFSANQYRIIIDSSSATPGNLFLDTIISSTAFNPSFNYLFSQDKAYYWQVLAGNGAVYSSPSSFRRFDLDRIGPDSVSMPVSFSFSGTTANLVWGGPTDAISYKVYIYKSDGVTLYNNNFPKVVTNASYNFTGVSGATYYWKVVAFDNAGNMGLPVSLRSFKIP